MIGIEGMVAYLSLCWHVGISFQEATEPLQEDLDRFFLSDALIQ